MQKSVISRTVSPTPRIYFLSILAVDELVAALRLFPVLREGCSKSSTSPMRTTVSRSSREGEEGGDARRGVEGEVEGEGGE